ncbi:MAG: hypothetical protein E6356_16870 [Terrisporobacter othiniensis]|nr:hypothetical protein [Terrisporobacter othiniensis]
MSEYATEEQQRDLEHQATLDAKYGYYDDYNDFLYEDNYDNECIIKNKGTKSKIKDECKILAFPISSSEANMKNKSCDYKTIAVMTLYSQPNIGEDTRYVYKNDLYLNQDEIEKMTGNKLDTVIRNVKKLVKLSGETVSAINTENNGICYLIKYSEDNKKYVCIERDILKMLTRVSNHNVIKTYIYIKYRCKVPNNGKDKNIEKYRKTKISNESICENIGLSKKSNCSKDAVREFTKDLISKGLIRKEKRGEVAIQSDGSEKFTYRNYYEIVNYEDWKRYDDSLDNNNNPIDNIKL